MKKLITIISLAAAMIALGSCNKAVNEVSEPQVKIEIPDGMYEFTLNAVWTKLEDADETKTTYASDQTFAWSAGDQISVLFHKDDDNQFFTLTNTTGAGATATFSGAVTKGYTLGASDTGTKWALFPASAAHSYGGSDAVSFNEIADNDYTAPGAHFSVNIPMYAHGDGSDNFVFKHLTGCYKLTFTNIPAAVKKVKLTAENIGNGYYLSGNSPILEDGGTYYLNCYTGSGSKIVSYTQNVSAGEVSFYIPYRSWEKLTPKFTLQNMTDGASKYFTILQLSAVKAITQSASLTKMVTLAPYDISAYGEGSPFISQLGVEWGGIDMYPADDSKAAFPGDGERIVDWKATSDASYVYFFLKITASVPQTRGVWESYISTGYDLDNNDTTGGDNGYSLGGGFEAYSIIFPFTNAAGDPVTFRSGARSDNKTKVYDAGAFTQTSSSEVATYGALAGDYAYVEVRVPRSRIGSPASSSTIRLRMSFGYTASAAQTITLQ